MRPHGLTPGSSMHARNGANIRQAHNYTYITARRVTTQPQNEWTTGQSQEVTIRTSKAKVGRQPNVTRSLERENVCRLAPCGRHLRECMQDTRSVGGRNCTHVERLEGRQQRRYTGALRWRNRHQRPLQARGRATRHSDAIRVSLRGHNGNVESLQRTA